MEQTECLFIGHTHFYSYSTVKKNQVLREFKVVPRIQKKIIDVKINILQHLRTILRTSQMIVDQFYYYLIQR